MFTLTEPSDNDVAQFLLDQSNLPFTYAQVGATRRHQANHFDAPRGFTVDHNRIQLGRGADVFQRAVDALRQWRQFELGWLSIAPRGVKIEKGATMAVKAWACGMWSLNACRVVYVVDEGEPLGKPAEVGGDEADGDRNIADANEPGPHAVETGEAELGGVRRFGFAYGTLPDHIERGEERFLIEWDRNDDTVSYDILAFSQPRHPLVKLGSPLARMMQKRFARDSLRVMKSAVHPV